MARTWSDDGSLLALGAVGLAAAGAAFLGRRGSSANGTAPQTVEDAVHYVAQKYGDDPEMAIRVLDTALAVTSAEARWGGGLPGVEMPNRGLVADIRFHLNRDDATLGDYLAMIVKRTEARCFFLHVEGRLSDRFMEVASKAEEIVREKRGDESEMLRSLKELANPS